MTEKKQAGIEQRVAKVSSVTGLATALSMGLQIVSVPLCLRYWGNDTYGSWLALFAAFTLMRTVDGGYTGYVGNKINILYHKDESALRLTLASAIWGVVFLGGVQLIILWLLYITNSMSFILNHQLGSITENEVALALFVLSISWIFSGSYMGIVHRFLIPTGFMYQAAWWSMGFQLAQFAAIIIAAILDFSILQAAILFALVQAVVYIASAVYIKAKLPHYYPWWTESSRITGIRDLVRSIPLTLSGMLQQGGNGGLIMLVSAFSGTAIVPVYTTIRTLGNLWTTLINILTTPLLPDVVRFHAKGEGRKLVSTHQAHWLLIGTIINLSILIAYPFLEFVYGAWTNNLLKLDKPLLGLLLATVSLAGMGSLMNTLLTGLNHSGFVITTAALRGGVSLFVGVFLLPVYGLTGLGIAILLAEICVLLVTSQWFFKRELLKIDSEIPLPSLGWLWLSSGCTIVYLLLASFEFAFANILYWFALSGVVLGSLFSWRSLDVDIKIRLSLLFGLIKTYFGIRVK